MPAVGVCGVARCALQPVVPDVQALVATRADLQHGRVRVDPQQVAFQQLEVEVQVAAKIDDGVVTSAWTETAMFCGFEMARHWSRK